MQRMIGGEGASHLRSGSARAPHFGQPNAFHPGGFVARHAAGEDRRRSRLNQHFGALDQLRIGWGEGGA